jgi:hypothetical protein
MPLAIEDAKEEGKMLTGSPLNGWFFMRDEYDRFRLDPEKDRAFLFGDRDRQLRDSLLESLHEGCLGSEGHKAVVYGDYGRGKTHQCQNLIYEIERSALPIVPVYVKCTEYGAKEPFSSLFSQMLAGLRLKTINSVFRGYQHAVKDGGAAPLENIVYSDALAKGFEALAHPNEGIARMALRWLGGEKMARAEVEQVGAGLPLQVALSRDFSSVMRGFSHAFSTVENKLIVFFVDEAERLGVITNRDAEVNWAASLRGLTESIEVGYIFFAGANRRDEIPSLLTWDEISTRIGLINFRNLNNPSRDDLRQWIEEFFQTFIRKGAAPESLRTALGASADEVEVPSELIEITGGDPDRLRAFPFTPEALNEFVQQSVTDELANKPREVLIRIQRAATRAARLGERVISVEILDRIRGEEF